MLVTPHILCRIRLALALPPGTSFVGISPTQSLTVLQKLFNCGSLLSDCYLPFNRWEESYACSTLCHPAQAVVQFPWGSGISLSVLPLAVFSSFLLLQMHRPPQCSYSLTCKMLTSKVLLLEKVSNGSYIPSSYSSPFCRSHRWFLFSFCLV